MENPNDILEAQRSERKKIKDLTKKICAKKDGGMHKQDDTKKLEKAFLNKSVVKQ